MTKLQAKNIVKHFDHNSNSVLALDGINLDVEEGDFICIVGPSGCGKSTFLNIVAGLEKLDSQTRDLLLVELQLIWERTKKTIIFVTHNISESVILGNRVAVFKNRPSKIKKEFVIDYRRPRLAEDENLQKYYHQILEELKSEVMARIKDENQ